MKVICINDKNRPNEIPANRWVTEGNVYTVIKVDKLNVQGGLYGFKLAELNIDDLAPYQYFLPSRFSTFDLVKNVTEVKNKTLKSLGI